MLEGHERPVCFQDLPHALAVIVFSHLSPLTLATASCVSRGFRDLASERPWRRFYAQLWPLPPTADAGGALPWQRQFGRRQLGSRCWLGRPSLDKLVGARDAVKAVCLLPQQGLLFAGAAPPGAGSVVLIEPPLLVLLVLLSHLLWQPT
jgi:hypothetical protein